MPFVIESTRHSDQPTLKEFGSKARIAFEKLPENVKKLCEDVLFEVSELPSQEVLESLGLESPYDLLGLFEGEGFAQTGGHEWTGRLPNRIWLYRQPILEFARDQTDSLDKIIAHVLVHEIGHHFGLSDDDMDLIDMSKS